MIWKDDQIEQTHAFFHESLIFTMFRESLWANLKSLPQYYLITRTVLVITTPESMLLDIITCNRHFLLFPLSSPWQWTFYSLSLALLGCICKVDHQFAICLWRIGCMAVWSCGAGVVLKLLKKNPYQVPVSFFLSSPASSESGYKALSHMFAHMPNMLTAIVIMD